MPPRSMKARFHNLVNGFCSANSISRCDPGASDGADPHNRMDEGSTLALHVPVAATGFLDGVAKVAMIALLIDLRVLPSTPTED